MRWHDDVFLALASMERTIGEAISARGDVPEAFIGMTQDEVKSHFDGAHDELELVTCLQRMAAAEAVLQLDFRARAAEESEQDDPLNADAQVLFRAKQEKKKRTELEELLTLWETHEPRGRLAIEAFRGTLHLRHWLAHGGYWKPRLARAKYDARLIFEISSALFETLPRVKGWPDGQFYEFGRDTASV
ncbi:hypothetical protein [Chondromyces apiculatus]|uniref:hypothetical protein n=1 Tax=Chondromyces apiculatus TaxID=51 RepID=UPI0012DFC77C|nr:hypothetical protein [Chondromyces apiculatus]